ncbi:MAG: DinB family protein [Ginsengibacter sp.]
MNDKKLLLAQYDSLYRWFINSLVDFTDEETNHRLNENMNHVKYLAGHLTNAQYAYAGIAGVEVERQWDELFAGLGKSSARDNFSYPTIQEVKAEWEQINQSVRDSLQALSEDALDKAMPGSPLAQSKVFDTTVGDFWAFMNMHQTYHIGQIGILRRGFGKEPMTFR